jgi:hypothetical protein
MSASPLTSTHIPTSFVGALSLSLGGGTFFVVSHLYLTE